MLDVREELEREVTGQRDEIERAVDEGKLDKFFEEDVLEVLRKQSMVSGKWKTMGYEALLVFGGPGVWFNTWDCEVEGHWAGSHSTRSVKREACLAIDNYLEDIYGEG